MPNLIIPIKATHESVTRLVCNDVTKQVMRMTGLSDKIPVRFPGEDGIDTQPGSTVGASADNIFEHHSRIFITVQEEYKDDAVINSAVRHNDSPYVFEDKAIGVVLKPIYSHTAVTINFEYRAATRGEVEAWRNDIKVRLADNRTAFLHDLNYHFEVPMSCLSIIAHVHDLRERVAGYGEDLGTYFKKQFSNRLSTLTNANGTGNLMVVGERAIGIQGWFEFIEPNQAEKDQGGASWTVTFSYKFHYQKPVSMNMQYPLIVHNQLISSTLFSKDRPYSLDDRPALHTETRASFESLADLARKPADPMGGIRTPEWDEWVPDVVPTYTTSLATWLLKVDPADPTLIMDMNDLGNQEITEFFRNFLLTEYQYVTKRGKALVLFTLFRGTEPMNELTIYMDADLKLRSHEPLSLRHVYHARLSAITEMSLFDEHAREAIRDNGCFSLLVWQALIPNLDVEYIASKMPVECFIGDKWFEWFYEYLREADGGNGAGQIGGGYGHGPGASGGIGWGTGYPYGPGGSDSGAGGNGPYPNVPGSPYYRSYYIEWPLVNVLTIIAARRS